jgi:colanic acid biosynthesis glycosyl transferase WcaI
MRILFLAQCYAPEEVSAAVLITELAVDLVKRGHQVTMVTGAPNYPQGRLFPGYRNSLYRVEWMEGVRVVRTWSYITASKSFWPRLLHYGTYCASALYGALFAGKADILVSYSPPLPLGLTAWLLSRLWRIPWVLQIEDLFPDAAVAAGMLHNRRVIDFFYAMERFLYRWADQISLITQCFREKLLAKGVPASKLTLIPVWADTQQVYPLEKENDFRRQHGLEGNFVVMYAGNIGLTSCLEDMIGAAQLLKDCAAVRFVLVGEGVKKAALEQQAREQGLGNMLFLPYQPRERFNEMLSAADLSLVTINPRAAETSLPSKVFNSMSSGRPILSIAPVGSDLAMLVADRACGINVSPGQPAQIAAVILQLKDKQALLDQMSQNGRQAVETTYSRQQCVDQHEELYRRVIHAPWGEHQHPSVRSV